MAQPLVGKNQRVAKTKAAMKEPFTIEELKTAERVCDAMHTNALRDCKIRTAQAITTTLSVIHAELARIEKYEK